MSIYDRFSNDEPVRRAGPNAAGDLLPWADPYIAQLWRQHRLDVAEEAGRDRRRADARVIPLRGEAPLPLGETPLPATKTHRRSGRARGLRVAVG